MGTPERSKKRVQLWKKAIVHFSLCFVMGFFSGFAPAASRASSSTLIPRTATSPGPTETRDLVAPANRSLISRVQQAQTIPVSPSKSEEEKEEEEEEEEEESTQPEEPEMESPWDPEKHVPRKQLIIITPTRADDPFRGVLLRRLATTIRLVPAPLLWVVVERQPETGSGEVPELLRKTGVMYRHLVYRENFTEPEAEMDHQRNVALRHIKQHGLTGIVHFAGLSNVYDLDFFHELRQTEVFGTWPIALLSANRKKVIIEGPVCDSTQVMGWHIKKMNNETDAKPPIHISSFSFNSSILWDPERWGRPSSSQAVAQVSVKFVKEIVHEDEASVKGISGEKCSRILMWHFPAHPSEHLLRVHDPNDRSNLQSDT
ncbi:probable beta-1,4-xylosyltransferase IRX9 [Punica granatum]|uniref:Glycosyltransferases n=2 Tax=Punica granatum TaxID=22663 RepID=A0A218XBT1_PUNGR|nr:probable beta-1,4-xylosyltransferase IRX9 [Punica granatum]OWM82384.1 hypothetical protein CDL15_Pgr001958 [Punica granatum]PKI32512.1 hypothetical protein CRG98_047092 [Punica granatum]